MISLYLALALAAEAAGEAELTLDGVTTTHDLKACATKAEGAMPARLLIEETGLTVTAARADHMQTISVLKDNASWSATRLFNGEAWTDKGEPAEPIVAEWGETIRLDAVLSASQAEGEKTASLTARCF